MWLAGDEESEPSLVVLTFPLPLYLTLASSLGRKSKCREQAWRYLISGTQAIAKAVADGTLEEGEWGGVPRAGR